MRAANVVVATPKNPRIATSRTAFRRTDRPLSQIPAQRRVESLTCERPAQHPHGEPDEPSPGQPEEQSPGNFPRDGNQRGRSHLPRERSFPSAVLLRRSAVGAAASARTVPAKGVRRAFCSSQQRSRGIDGLLEQRLNGFICTSRSVVTAVTIRRAVTSARAPADFTRGQAMTSGVVRTRKLCLIGILTGMRAVLADTESVPSNRLRTARRRGPREETGESNLRSRQRAVPVQLGTERRARMKPTRFILNVQPVMPFALNQDWNLITRVIVPLREPAARSPTAASRRPASATFSRRSSSRPSRPGLIVGRGTSNQPARPRAFRRSARRSGAPDRPIVVLKQTGKMTYGALWNQVWSFSGNTEPR